MEKAGEIVQSVISGHFDLRKQPIQEFQLLSEDNQNFACSGQPSIRQHKIQECPFRRDSNSSCAGSGSAGQQNQRHQSKLEDMPLHDGDRQNTGSSEQNSGATGQQNRKQHHKFQEVPQTSGQKQGTPSSSTNPYGALVDCLRAIWLTGKTRPIEYRRTQLEALSRFLDENEAEILHALCADMRRPPFEGHIADISLIKNEVNHALNNLSCWMKDESADKNLATKLDCAFVRKDPYGVVLIISPFNYPFQLTLVPMVGAIAAGNSVIIKPSEQSTCSEKLLAEVLPTYLDPDTFAVVTGGPEQTSKLLENKFDYIMFTGSPPIGKIVMSAAAKHLTPLTLELGGQNPCYVDCCCNFQNTANRIVWAKFFNCGQTCLAPDYVICTIETQERLMPCLRQAIREFYGCNPRDSPDFGRMINDKHFQRVRALLDCGRVAIGGETDECDRYIAPTILADVKEWEPIMQQEVFGPILPIFTVRDLDEAIQYINSKERPLAVYAFSCDCKVVNRVLDCTSSGGFCGNDCMMHVTLVSLPFGGIGYSGMGKYHGKYGFDTFTHERGCLYRCMGLEAINCVRYPPYSQRKLDLLISTTEVKRRSFCTLL